MASYNPPASHSTAHNCYCAFCRTPRRVSLRKRLGVLHVFLSIFSGFLISLIWFQGFDPRAVLFIVMSLVFGEMFMQIRWRLAVVCKSCGFDPVLYTKEPTLAAEKVKKFLAAKKSDPSRMLARPLKLPTITPERLLEIQAEVQAEKKPGRILSRTI